MRKLASIFLGLALALPWSSRAGAEALEGRVVHPDGRELEGVTVRLVAPKPEGGFDTAEERTRKDGRFSFDVERRGTKYGVYAEYDDITFPIEVVEVPRESGTPLPPVELRVYDRSSDDSRLQLFDVRTVLDRGEAGSYRVQQSVGIFNPDQAVVFSPDDRDPRVRIGLVPDYEQVLGGLNFQATMLPAEVEVEGPLATYRGPIFPGPQALEITYEVDAGGPDLEADLWFPDPVDSFRLIVPDRRQAVYATGLFPSARTKDEPGGFQYFRGYDLAAGTRIPLRIEEIPEPNASMSVPAAMAFFVLMFGLSIFVGMPIAAAARAAVPEGDEARVTPGDALAVALTDLEYDFEMGKISAEDRDQLREELRREALLEMAREQAAPAAPPPPAAVETRAASFCSNCGQRAGEGARFCSACGTKL